MTEPVPQRIGDAERDRAAECLREHLAQGRLQQDEFDERLGAALRARTAADLEPLFADLPDPRPSSVTGGAVAPATSWPTYPTTPTTPPPAAAPVPVGEPNRPVVSRSVANGLAIAASVAWPLWIIAAIATSWHVGWLIWIPIMISIIAGAVRRNSSDYGR